MSNKVVQELNNSHSPEAYVSNFTFFNRPEVRDVISRFNAPELCVSICQKPSDSGRYIHEMWRIGHLNILFEFLTMNMACIGNPAAYPFRRFLKSKEVENGLISDVAVMMKIGKVSAEESAAFLYDISVVSFNAQNGFELEYEPVESEGIKEKVSQMMVLAQRMDFSIPEETIGIPEGT